MLDLKAGVHLQEEELASVRIDDEFHRSRTVVRDMPGESQGGFMQATTSVVRQVRRGSLFEQFLVAALRRAVACAEVDDIAVLVADHLHLDMAGTLDVALDDDPIVAE